MKLYSKIVIDIATGKQLFAESSDYEGEVAQCGGKAPKPQFGKPAYSVASQIVGGNLRQPLESAIQQDIITNPFTNRSSDQYKRAVSDIRGGYGARGLEGSGIAIRGEQDALQKIVNEAAAARAGQLTGVLATASGSPSFPSGANAPEGRGFMGMK